MECSNGQSCVEDTPGKATCSSTRSEKCPPTIITTDFICTGQGVFPDPLNCMKFYDCYTDSTGELIADPYECDNLYVFDPSLPHPFYCRRSNIYKAYCVEANCKDSTQTKLLSYPFFSAARGQIIAKCRGTKKPLVFRCPAGFVADLNSLPIQCNLRCTGAGRFEDPESLAEGDDSFYLECVFDGRIWTPKKKACFRSMFFNPKSKLCEEKASTPPPVTTTTTTTTLPTPLPTCEEKCAVDNTADPALTDCKIQCICETKEAPAKATCESSSAACATTTPCSTETGDEKVTCVKNCVTDKACESECTTFTSTCGTNCLITNCALSCKACTDSCSDPALPACSGCLAQNSCETQCKACTAAPCVLESPMVVGDCPGRCTKCVEKAQCVTETASCQTCFVAAVDPA